jgi:S1-C subfamily serine protease
LKPPSLFSWRDVYILAAKSLCGFKPTRDPFAGRTDMHNNLMRIKNKTGRTLFTLLSLLFMLGFSQPGWGLDSERESPVVRAVRKVSPAVVNISSSYEVRKRANPFSGFGMDPFFEEFFKDFFDPRFESRRKSTSLGSGVIIDGKRGFILTNAHVIERSGNIKVVLEDEREFEAKIVGADPDSDLAVLQIDSPARLPSIEMGSSDDLMIGETVIAIGNPFGFSHTVTTGVISAVDRSIRSEQRVFLDFIQIDASINPGNSGGPLLNINAWIGITVQNLDKKLAGYLKVPGKKGVMVKALEPDSPASNAGLQEGDIILAIGNKKIASVQDYGSVKKTYAAGDTLKAQIWRNGKTETVRIKSRVFPMEMAEGLALRLMGIRVEDLTAKNRKNYRIQIRQGVVISEIDGRSDLARIGARPGDVILQIDDAAISNKDDFKKAIVKYRQRRSVVILLQRGDQGYYITVRL